MNSIVLRTLVDLKCGGAEELYDKIKSYDRKEMMSLCTLPFINMLTSTFINMSEDTVLITIVSIITLVYSICSIMYVVKLELFSCLMRKRYIGNLDNESKLKLIHALDLRIREKDNKRYFKLMHTKYYL